MSRTALFFLALAFGSTSPAFAESWRVVGQGGGAPQRMVHLVDTDSISREGDTVRFSSMTIWEDRAPDGNFDKSVAEREGDCMAKSSAIISLSYYTNGSLVDTEYGNGEAVAHGPSSTGRALLDAACGLREYATAPLADPEASVRGNFARSP